MVLADVYVFKIKTTYYGQQFPLLIFLIAGKKLKISPIWLYHYKHLFRHLSKILLKKTSHKNIKFLEHSIFICIGAS